MNSGQMLSSPLGVGEETPNVGDYDSQLVGSPTNKIFALEKDHATTTCTPDNDGTLSKSSLEDLNRQVGLQHMGSP